MSKKPPTKKISEKEKARRQAVAAQAHDESHTAPKKFAGKDMHFDMTKPRLMRHQSR